MSDEKYKPPGTKTSFYLTADLAERVRTSGLKPRELLVRGLDAGTPEPIEALLRRVIREELGPAERKPGPRDRSPDDCPHPKSRINKGLCGNCGQHVT